MPWCCFRTKENDSPEPDPGPRRVVTEPEKAPTGAIPVIPGSQPSASTSLLPGIQSTQNPVSQVIVAPEPAIAEGSLAQSPVVVSPALAFESSAPGLTSTPPQSPAASAKQVSPSGTKTPWEKAIERLDPEDRKQIDSNLQNQDKLKILKGLVEVTKEQRAVCEEKQWKYKNSSGEEVLVRDSVNSLLLNLKKFSAIGDLVVQPLPSVVSLAWGGFKLLLQLAIDDMECRAIAMESLDSLARILGHCAIYERLYGQQGLDASQCLNDALVDLYVLVLEYLCYLKRHLGHNTAVQSFKNLASGLKLRWEALLSTESAVDKEAMIAHQEATAKQLDVNNENMEKMVALLKDTNALREPILQIKNTVDNIFELIKDDERLRILNWLSELSPMKNHQFNKSLRADGTGMWLLGKDNFRNWSSSNSSSLLWLHGIAGSGKTTLASNIIDHVGTEIKTNNHSLAYFYCNYKEAERRDPASILRSLVKQLCLSGPKSSLPEVVLSVYNNRKEDADLTNLLTVDECKDLLITLSAGFLRTTIIIDALDECDPKTRGQLFNVLEDIVSLSKRNPVKAFVTSRDDGDLRKKFQDHPNVYIQERDNSADINDYIRTGIKACIKDKKLLGGVVSQAFEERIVVALQAGARGMFIWVKHQMERICDETTGSGIERALTEFPDDLDEMYTEIMHRIKRNKSPRTSAIVENALKWVLFAVRPLSPKELIAAILFSPTASSDGMTLKEVFDICQNFIVLDGSSGVVRFAHYSVQEFLLKQFNVVKNHTELAVVCLTLLLSSELLVTANALTDYTIFNWPEHVRMTGDGTYTLNRLCNTFLTPSPVYTAWVSRISKRHQELWLPQDETCTIPPLVVASYFQLLNAVENLLHADIDHNGTNYFKRNSFHLAASNGNEKITILLVEKCRAIINSRDWSGRTPLSFAAENGHDKVVEILLEKEDVDVDSKEINGRTPLSLAAKNGHDKVVKMLLEKEDVDVNNKDTRSGQTPLSRAAKNGHDRVVEMLLKMEGVDVNRKDNTGRNPLSRAAENGHDKVVEMLLKTEGVDVDSKDTRYGQTPLSRAAENGHDKVVEMLLKMEGVDVNRKDTTGRTPLSRAAENGHDKVVEMLLKMEGVDVNRKDTTGQTPLSWAAENGRGRVVKLLLEEEDVDVDSKDTSGRSPLSWAADNRHDEVVEILRLSRRRAGTNARTPLA